MNTSIQFNCDIDVSLQCYRLENSPKKIINTVESRFYEPPREKKIGSKNRRVQEIGGKITVFD